MTPTTTLPLRASRGAAGTLRIHCCACGDARDFNDAAAHGWTFDPQGPSFVAYYCAACSPPKETTT